MTSHNSDYAYDDPSFAQAWRERSLHLIMMPTPTKVPEGVVERITDPKVLEEYKRGKEVGCADIILLTQKPDNTPAVLLSKRKGTQAFGGTWWVYGGSIPAYKNILDFVAECAERECGVYVKPEVLVGFYRTCSENVAQSTSQPCFAGRVAYHVVEAKMSTDPEHDSIRLFTLEDLENIPQSEQHWYPLHVARLVLNAAPTL